MHGNFVGEPNQNGAYKAEEKTCEYGVEFLGFYLPPNNNLINTEKSDCHTTVALFSETLIKTFA